VTQRKICLDLLQFPWIKRLILEARPQRLVADCVNDWQHSWKLLSVSVMDLVCVCRQSVVENKPVFFA